MRFGVVSGSSGGTLVNVIVRLYFLRSVDPLIKNQLLKNDI